MKRRVEELAAVQADLSLQIDELRDHRERHTLDINSIKQDMGYMRAGVERIQAMLERLMERAP